MNDKYCGRISVTREALAAFLGLPQSIDAIDITYDYTMDTYNFILRANKVITFQDQQLTFKVPQGMMIPNINYTPPERIIMVEETVIDEPPNDMEELLENINSDDNNSNIERGT
jgi:hypothetical protein